MNRRVLIVTDVALACLFVVGAVIILVLRGPASIVGGISALAIGAACAVTALLFIRAGGWSKDRAPHDPGPRARVLQPRRTRERQ